MTSSLASSLTYRPAHRPLQRAAPLPAIAYVAALTIPALAFSNPLVLAGAGLAVVVAGLASGARPALIAALRIALVLGITIVAVNVLVSDRGETLLVRGWEVPLLGGLDVTLESLLAGSVIALRVGVVVAAFAVYSACVDPDRVLHLVRPLAARSAMTATLVSRAIPLAIADRARLREAARLRGPAAAPATRLVLARRLLAGSLDRAVDAAATLELRGYGLDFRVAPVATARGSRHNGAFALAAALMLGAVLAAAVAGAGGFDPYPSIAIDAGNGTVALALALPLLAALPFVEARRG